MPNTQFGLAFMRSPEVVFDDLGVRYQIGKMSREIRRRSGNRDDAIVAVRNRRVQICAPEGQVPTIAVLRLL